MTKPLRDAHRHIGRMPAYPFYGGPAITADVTAKGTVDELIADLDAAGIERALVLPNYGVPDPDVAFELNGLAIDAAQRDDRIRCGLWVSPKPSDADRNAKALALAGEQGVAALKTSFLLGGHPADPACRLQLDQIFATAREHGLVVHIHTSPGAASDIDQVGALVEEYAHPDGVPIHLVHLGGGMSGHMKLIGDRLFDWLERGFKVYTDTSWTIGFAPVWLVREIERRGIGHDRILFATDAPWGDFEGEYARLRAAAGDGDLADAFFSENFSALYGLDPATTRNLSSAPTTPPSGQKSPSQDRDYPGPRDWRDIGSVQLCLFSGPANQRIGESMTESTAGIGDIEAEIQANIERSLSEIPHPSQAAGTSIYGSTKIFPDYRAEDGESYFTLIHGIPHESSVSFVAILQATRALRKGFESAIYFYGPGTLACMATRGFPTTGDSGFPGEQNTNGSIETFIKEGGTVFCCRFGMALHGLREEDLIEGVIPSHPLDVQDALIHYARKGAIINSTYNL